MRKASSPWAMQAITRGGTCAPMSASTRSARRPGWMRDAGLPAADHPGAGIEADAAIALDISVSANALEIPDNVTLVTLPPCSPELNPVERLWLYLRQSFLRLRVRGRP